MGILSNTLQHNMRVILYGSPTTVLHIFESPLVCTV